MKKARSLLAACTLAACLAHGQAPSAQAQTFREAQWEELMPKDWDPFARFRGQNLGMLSDSDPKVIELMRELRQTLDNAPTNAAMVGAAVKLPGYVVPLETPKGDVKEFLLVPYFGACIHTPPPPSNQIVHVVAAKPLKGFRAMEAVWVSGVLEAQRQDSPMGVSGYTMRAAAVERYERSGRP